MKKFYEKSEIWFGVSMHYDLYHQISAVITMAIVGYVEEIIFRGLLYKAIEKDNVKQAIIISAVTFGAGHIVNLLTGHGSVDTILQMANAIAMGFAFAMCFYKSGSLLALWSNCFYYTCSGSIRIILTQSKQKCRR